ncbi:tRNA (adenosine(37)-N6)-dimethylallyltransferase MiaA [Spongiibacter sp. KMU-158]|uniref:tRNA dimethylallyltransferase n=2 Tax=Spongiibacter pelagi TaxID=2760804 RepID=A0A927C1R6_9GAMM|nr:tRNA (adenosine(37)-N6)-dimethylallyltransferase MiaA [Spongiibacter pelagi]
MGPTASGKTDLAIKLSEQLPCDLISVDSALVYRGLDIGSAKPDGQTLAKHPHALIDICDPAEVYSAADFRRDALAEIETSLANGRTPVLVGGTMMYFKALLEGLAEMPAADPEIRQEIECLAQEQGWAAVHAELARVDPDMAAQIHPNHSQRLSRALEVFRISGVTMSEWRQRQTAAKLPFRPLQFAIAPQNRDELHRRIALRLDMMFDAGFVAEVEQLKARGDLHLDLPSMRAVGYRQVWQYLAGEFDLAEARERALIASRQLAKRQLTWLRSWPEIHWLGTPLGTVSQQDGTISRNLAQIQALLVTSSSE